MSSDPYQVQQCIENKELITLLIEMIHREPEEIAKECMMCFTNATFRGNFHQIWFLVENGILSIFVEALSQPMNDLFLMDEILQAVSNILNLGGGNMVNGQNLLKQNLEQLGIVRILDHLLKTENEGIRKRCMAIIEENFGESGVFDLCQN